MSSAPARHCAKYWDVLDGYARRALKRPNGGEFDVCAMWMRDYPSAMRPPSKEDVQQMLNLLQAKASA